MDKSLPDMQQPSCGSIWFHKAITILPLAT